MQNLKIKVSIIIPIYNTEKYLQECLNSIINQTLKEIEIICINDASTDNSLNILKEYASKDPRITIINNIKNLGSPGAVKNIGLDVAKGNYIAFVDSDDFIDLNYFEVLYNNAREENADISCTLKIRKFNESCSLGYMNYTLNKLILASPQEKQLLMKISGHNWNKIYLRSMLIENRIYCSTRSSIAEDNYFSMLAMIFANKIVTTKEVAYHYRRHSTNITAHTRNQNDFNILDVYKDIDDFIQPLITQNQINNVYQEILNTRKLQEVQHFILGCDLNCILPFLEKTKDYFPDLSYCFANKYIYVSSTTSSLKIADLRFFNVEDLNISFLQKIFSITNSPDKKYKIIRLLWLKLKFRTKYY